jgi:hypothetical protein
MHGVVVNSMMSGCVFACVAQGPVADGCFWISYADFCKVYDTIFAVRLLTTEDGWLMERREVCSSCLCKPLSLQSMLFVCASTRVLRSAQQSRGCAAR